MGSLLKAGWDAMVAVLFGAMPLAVGATGLERDLIRRFERAPVLDGDLADWVNQPGLPWGYDERSEAIAHGRVWLGWTPEGLFFALHVKEAYKVGGKRKAGERPIIDLIFDTRPPDEGLYHRYEPGVFRARVYLKDDSPGNSRLELWDGEKQTFAEPGFAPSVSVVRRQESTSVEGYVPWSAATGFTAAVDGSLPLAIRIWSSALGQFVVASPGVPAGKANEEPFDLMTLWTYRLGAPASTASSWAVTAEEIALQGTPTLLFDLVLPAESTDLAKRRLEFRLVEEQELRVALVRATVAGGFWRAHAEIPLALDGRAETEIVWRFSDSSTWSRTVVPTPLRRCLSQIRATLPDAVVDSMHARLRSVVVLLRACAEDAAADVCLAPNGVRHGRRIARMRQDPAPAMARVENFLSHALDLMRGRLPCDLSYPFYAWQSRLDRAWLPLVVTLPWNLQAGKKYPVRLKITGANETRDRSRFLEPELAQFEQGLFRRGVGDMITVTLFGRGNAPDHVANEEIPYVLDILARELPADRSRVFLTGESFGASAALDLALQEPFLFSSLWLRSGAFGRYLPGPTNSLPLLAENLRGLGVYVEVGKNDPVRPRSAELAECLAGADVMVRMDEWPGTPHTFIPHFPPSEVLATEIDQRRNRFSFATVSPDFGRANPVSIDAMEESGLATIAVQYQANGTMQVATKNVAALSFASLETTPPVSRVMIVDGEEISLPPQATPDGRSRLFRTHGAWRQDAGASPRLAKQVGRCGPADRIETAPVLIVYGTRQKHDTAIRAMRAAAIVRARIGTDIGQLAAGRLVVKPDTAVTEEDIATNNLWLIGGPEENSVSAGFGAALPVASGGGELRLDERIFRDDCGLLLTTIFPKPMGVGYVICEVATSALGYMGKVVLSKTHDIVLQRVTPEASDEVWAGSYDVLWRLPPSRP